MVSLLLVLPIALPGIVTGIAALRLCWGDASPFSFWTIVIGHATFCVVWSSTMPRPRFRRTSQNLIRSVDGLGDGFQTLLRDPAQPRHRPWLAAACWRLPSALTGDRHPPSPLASKTTLPIWMLQDNPATPLMTYTNVVALMLVTPFPPSDPGGYYLTATARVYWQCPMARPTRAQGAIMKSDNFDLVAGAGEPMPVMNPSTRRRAVAIAASAEQVLAGR